MLGRRRARAGARAGARHVVGECSACEDRFELGAGRDAPGWRGVSSGALTELEKLSADEILRTARRLRERIAERFPSAGLLGVADQLVELASRAHATCRELARPNWTVRVIVFAGIALLLIASIAAAAFGLTSMGASETVSWPELVQVAEAGANDLVLLGAAIYFFVSFETRFKRGKVVKALHQLRTLAHLIDAHQLTKTPEVLGHDALRTASSPARALSAFELGRYLDYCTEMLSLTGKIAALYGDGFGDSESLEAVNEIEALTVGLQSKIWQKLILLQAGSPGGFAGDGDGDGGRGRGRGRGRGTLTMPMPTPMPMPMRARHARRLWERCAPRMGAPSAAGACSRSEVDDEQRSHLAAAPRVAALRSRTALARWLRARPRPTRGSAARTPRSVGRAAATRSGRSSRTPRPCAW